MPVPIHHGSLDRADTLQIAENLDRALGIFQSQVAQKSPTTLEIYLQSVLSTLRRELLERAEALRE